MTFNEYQSAARKFADYKKRILYPACGICGEAGEIAEKIKKAHRDFDDKYDDELKRHIMLECGDVMWYVSALLDDLDIELEDIVPSLKTNSYRTFACLLLVNDFLGLGTDIVALSSDLGRYVKNEYSILETENEKGKKKFIAEVIVKASYVVGCIRLLAHKLGYTLDDVVYNNIEKLESRKQRDKINGSGDDR